LLVACALGVAEGQGPPKSREAEVKQHLGAVATFCGTIVAYQCTPPDQTTVLLWEKPVEATGVGIAIAQTDRARFDSLLEPRSLFLNACATGRVEKLNKRYVVRVTDPNQLQVQGGVTPAIPIDPGAVSVCAVGVERPQIVKAVQPAYTPAAMSAGIQGTVLLEAVVLADGTVGQIRVVHSLDAKRGLDAQAIRAFRDWRFTPATLNGQVVPVVIGVELTFSLR